MDLKAIVDSLKTCNCGREHNINIKEVAIGKKMIEKTAEILKRNGFGTRLLAVADKNTIAAAKGILEILTNGGFTYKLKLYDNLRTADMSDAQDIITLAADVDGILSIGTGSLNDICRYAALHADKDFAIFATAPSMDGFASDTSPITEHNFKQTLPARQPSVIIADTDILAAAPAELKSAGFGDVIAKYIAVVDWKISALVSGEYYCENICNITKEALRRITALADRITLNDPESAGAVMEALVLTGCAMKLANSVRPASGAEHIVSHFWEIKKLEKGLLSDFHGKKVGVATLITAKIYHDFANSKGTVFTAENTDWEKVYSVYGKNFEADIKRLNNPNVTDTTTPEILNANLDRIVEIIKTELPDYETLCELMDSAHAAKTFAEIGVDSELGRIGVEYHAYMRYRLTLMRLLPMTNYRYDSAEMLKEFM